MTHTHYHIRYMYVSTVLVVVNSSIVNFILLLCQLWMHSFWLVPHKQLEYYNRIREYGSALYVGMAWKTMAACTFQLQVMS